jgi:hypothetical protein
MSAKTISAVIGTLLVAAGCGKRVPVPSSDPAGTPRVGWVIMVGDRDNPDREFVCQSEPRTECVMPATRPDNQAVTDVHFYFHPTPSDTTYSGTIKIAFFEGSAPHDMKINLAVKPGDPAGKSSVSAVVSAKPGKYPMTIDVVAEGATAQHIRDLVPVTVQ